MLCPQLDSSANVHTFFELIIRAAYGVYIRPRIVLFSFSLALSDVAANHSPFSKTDGRILIDELGTAWKQVARSLDINDADIDTIQHDFYKDGLKEMIYQMIKLWKNQVGNKEASVAAMAKALHDCQEYNLLEKLGNNS